MAPVISLRRQRAPTGFSHSGLVRFDEQFYPCNVTEMSLSGATLTFKMPVELPERFTLQLTATNVIRQCRVTWDEGLKFGVVFDGH